MNESIVFRPDTERVLGERFRANEKDPDVIFTYAALRALQGRFDEAIDWLRQLEEIEPRYPGMWRLKAKIYELKGDAEAAAFYWKMGCDDSR